MSSRKRPIGRVIDDSGMQRFLSIDDSTRAFNTLRKLGCHEVSRWVLLGEVAIMLQEFLPERHPKETLGTGVNVCFQCEDALTLYREFKSRGIQTRTRPFVGNRSWVVPVNDPDGYRMEFSSPTDAPEESELEE
jgi:hypothetical protein